MTKSVTGAGKITTPQAERLNRSLSQDFWSTFLYYAPIFCYSAIAAVITNPSVASSLGEIENNHDIIYDELNNHYKNS